MSDIAFFLFNIDMTSSASYGDKPKVSVIFFHVLSFGFFGQSQISTSKVKWTFVAVINFN